MKETTIAVPAGRPARVERLKSRRFLIILAVALAILVGGALWLHERSKHVYANDARVAAHVVAVSSEVAGRLDGLNVVPGQRVRKGQLLARIEPRDARFSLAEAQANLAGLDAQEQQIRVQQVAIRSRVGEATVASDAGVRAAEAELGVRRAELAAAQRNFERSRPLLDRGFVSRSRFDEDQARLRAAQQNVERAQAQIGSARANVGVTRSENDQIAVLEEQIEAIRAQKKALQASLGQRRLDLARTEIRAQFDGIIDQTFVDAGEYATPGTRILMYHNPDDIWIDINVKETEFRKIAPGARAKVEVDAYPGRAFEARVSHLGGATTSQFALLPAGNPSGNFTKVTQRLPIRLELRRPDDALKPGMMVEATIDVVD